jgi:hypothetical protein
MPARSRGPGSWEAVGSSPRAVSPHTLQHTSSTWCSTSKVPASRRRMDLTTSAGVREPRRCPREQASGRWITGMGDCGKWSTGGCSKVQEGQGGPSGNDRPGLSPLRTEPPKGRARHSAEWTTAPSLARVECGSPSGTHPAPSPTVPVMHEGPTGVGGWLDCTARPPTEGRRAVEVLEELLEHNSAARIRTS